MPEDDDRPATLGRVLGRQLVRSLPALAGGVVVALLLGWAVLGWSSGLLLPVGAVVAAWLVGEVVRFVLDLDDPRR